MCPEERQGWFHGAVLVRSSEDCGSFVRSLAVRLVAGEERLVVVGSAQRLEAARQALAGSVAQGSQIEYRLLPVDDPGSDRPQRVRDDLPAWYVLFGPEDGDLARRREAEERVARRLGEGDHGLVCVYTTDDVCECHELILAHPVALRGEDALRVLDKICGRVEPGDVKAVAYANRFRALGELCAGVAHELGNPLTLISSAVQKIHDHFDASEKGCEGRKYSEMILDQIRRMDGLLRNLREFVVEPHEARQVADVNEIVLELGRFLLPECERRRIGLVLQPDERPARGLWDTSAVRQILLNLLVNAMEALGETRDGAITMRTCLDDAGKCLTIEVMNNGPPLSVEPARLFRPFVTSKPQGTGLGLYLSRRLARSEHGDLQVRNLDAGGVCFTLRLPVRWLDDQVAAEAPRGEHRV